MKMKRLLVCVLTLALVFSLGQGLFTVTKSAKAAQNYVWVKVGEKYNDFEKCHNGILLGDVEYYWNNTSTSARFYAQHDINVGVPSKNRGSCTFGYGWTIPPNEFPADQTGIKIEYEVAMFNLSGLYQKRYEQSTNSDDNPYVTLPGRLKIWTKEMEVSTGTKLSDTGALTLTAQYDNDSKVGETIDIIVSADICYNYGKATAFKEELKPVATYTYELREAGGASPTTNPGSTSAPGTTAKPGTTAAPGTTAKPGTTAAPGTTTAPGTTAKPGTTTAPGTTPIPGSTAKPGTTAAPGSTTSPDDSPGKTSYGVVLGNTPVTSRNKSDILGDGKASYDPSTNTLYLKGVNVNTQYETLDDGINYHCGVYASGIDLTLNLSGKNTLKLPAVSGQSGDQVSFGIYAKSLKITGTGELEMEAGSVTDCTGDMISVGIFTGTGIDHQGGDVTCGGGDYAKESYGVYCYEGSYKRSGNALLYAYGKTAAVHFPGGIIYAADTLVQLTDDYEKEKADVEGKNLPYDQVKNYIVAILEPYGNGSGSDAGSGGGSGTGGGTGGGGSTTTQSKPKWKTKWTHGYDVYNVWVTSGARVTIVPVNKLAKSSSIKWIKNGKVAKICWKKNYKRGNYKFRARCKAKGGWSSSKYTITIDAS